MAWMRGSRRSARGSEGARVERRKSEGWRARGKKKRERAPHCRPSLGADFSPSLSLSFKPLPSVPRPRSLLHASGRERRSRVRWKPKERSRAKSMHATLRRLARPLELGAFDRGAKRPSFHLLSPSSPSPSSSQHLSPPPSPFQKASSSPWGS